MNKICITITLIFSAAIYSNEVNDPFENINRKTFEFNENLDDILNFHLELKME